MSAFLLLLSFSCFCGAVVSRGRQKSSDLKKAELGEIPTRMTLRLVKEAVGLDKLTVMAGAVDSLKDDFENFRREVRIDDEIETLNLSDLAEQYAVGERTLRDQIERRLGKGCVIKVGRKWVIRKRRFLDFLNFEESCGEDR
jgi:hypothetical protein